MSQRLRVGSVTFQKTIPKPASARGQVEQPPGPLPGPPPEPAPPPPAPPPEPPEPPLDAPPDGPPEPLHSGQLGAGSSDSTPAVGWLGSSPSSSPSSLGQS